MKKLYFAVTALVLGACATQTPAPVLSGYSRMPWEPKLTKVETTPAVQQHIAATNQNAHRLTQKPVYAPSLAGQAQPAVQAEPLAASSYQQLAAIQPAAGPATLPQPAHVQPEVPAIPQMGTHVVRQGETLYRLSKQYDVTVGDILSANNKQDATIQSGEILLIPHLAPATVARVEQTVPQAAPQQRYSLTRRTTTTAPAQSTVAQNMAAVEPAAGPTTLPQKTVTSPVSYRTHQVQAGETLYRIGKAYGVTPFDLMAANDFDKPQDLMAGTQIRVPVTGAKTATPVQRANVQRINQQLAKARGMVWPVEGKILNHYGSQGQGITNTGLNIAVPENTPIAAAAAGTVIYADDGLKSYGNLVLIRHADGLVTAYGHNNELLVKKDQKVQKGETIALSGRSGNVTTPQLHFEVRRNAQAINPLNVLPKPSVASR